MFNIRNSVASITVLTVLALPICAKDSDQSFAGKWVLDKKGPRAPQCPDDLRQDIRQRGSEITIQSKFKEPANGIAPLLFLGIMTSSLSLTTDGQTAQNQIGPFQQASKTTVDGRKMETEWNAMVNGDEVKGHWTRTLSEDGKHMTLEIKESSTKGQGGDATVQFVRK
ncbi:MAG: hypothetical protein M3Y27_22445 [Acidobacteriota bacterium]|nr:hypothetical protein [Acidobacteriota bacterium]